MAKFSSLVFLLALTLSIHTVLGTFDTAEYFRNQFKSAAPGMAGAAAENIQMLEDAAKDSSGSWSSWVKAKLEALGHAFSGSPQPAEAPADAPGPSSHTFSDSTGSAGYAPAGAPLAY